MLRLSLFPSPYSEGISLASRQTISCAIKISSEISFNPVILGRRNVVSEILSYYFKMIKWWLKANVILTIYPYICINLRRKYFLRKLESMLISWLNKTKYSILYVVDLPIEQAAVEIQQNDAYKKACEIEARIFKSFDVLLVFNENMKKKIQEKYGLDDGKFVLFEMLDYEADYVYSGRKKIQKPIKIAFLASSLSRNRFSWIKELPFSEGIIYSFFGNDGEWLKELGRNDIEYKGTIPPKEISRVLSQQY
ncbi:MAG: hypothetical protein N3A69_12680, partial [Leptospiraceae bacterium]|nr:hypothetical protein [Leptospiraceae bacterium]